MGLTSLGSDCDVKSLDQIALMGCAFLGCVLLRRKLLGWGLWKGPAGLTGFFLTKLCKSEVISLKFKHGQVLPSDSVSYLADVTCCLRERQRECPRLEKDLEGELEEQALHFEPGQSLPQKLGQYSQASVLGDPYSGWLPESFSVGPLRL